ncbi:MAG: ABC-F family ATP-binding cassette domain-containing protein [Eubacteriales bacterium]|nr:ABC-F family ATP-binding cassette domain-containing protein [Eubacteriales bacterium]
MIIACHHISKEFIEKSVLKDITFHLEKGDRAAIVGANGAGKTTLLRIMAGEMEADSGSVTLSGGAKLGYLAQDQGLDASNTIYAEALEAKREIIEMEELLSRYEQEMESVKGNALNELIESYTNLLHRFERMNGYAYKGEIVGVLRGLGFSDEEFEKQISTLSGGQKTRVALARLLLETPDVIMLDEPTNHLDLGSIRWLENYLANYRGTVLIVSHDRYFLDRTVTKVIEIENAAATFFTGNYSVYAEKKKALRDQQRRAWLNNQAQIRHQEEVIAKLKQFNREKSIKRAESREKMLRKMEVIEKPFTIRDDMNLKLTPCIRSGREVLTVENLGKSFDGQPLFSGISFHLRRGEHVAMIGDNGTGKTTILRILNGLLGQDAGHIRLGTNVHIGYYDQEHHVLDDSNTVFEEIAYAFPSMTNTEVRSLLASFLFTGDDVFKLIGELSGGEKGRVSLAKLMLSEANLLILDEPTNHLDIVSREVLENALNAYDGTVLYVSHDRYFINRTASRILELTHRVLLNYPGNNSEEVPDKYIGNYDFYVEKSAQIGEKLLENQKLEQAEDGRRAGRASAAGNTADSLKGRQETKNTAAAEPPSGRRTGTAPALAETRIEGADDWKARKEEQARRRKIANDLKKCETEIARLEEEGADLDGQISLPENSTDPDKLRLLSEKRAQTDEKLAELYEQWERLSEQAESE